MQNANKNTLRILVTAGAWTVNLFVGTLLVMHAVNMLGLDKAYVTDEYNVPVHVKKIEKWGGFYHYGKDVIYIDRNSACNKIIAHELKHARDGATFPHTTNINAEEISARCAEFLINNKQFNLDSNKIMKFPRDVNYIIPDTNQHWADSVLNQSINMWHKSMPKYKKQRFICFWYCTLNMLTDADLEKLFTFTINGKSRSLFTECRPETRAKLRRECNRDCIAYTLHGRLQRD